MLPSRGSVPNEGELLAASKSRFEQIELCEELRLSKAWELFTLSQQLLGLASAAGQPLDAARVLDVASLPIGPVALASSPSWSDRVLGRVVATRGSRSVSIAHERRPVDPFDWLRAFFLAGLQRDAGALAALSRSVEYVEPDRVTTGRGAPERALHRALLGALTAFALGQHERASVLTAEGDQLLAEMSGQLDPLTAERLRHLVLPLTRFVQREGREQTFRAAVEQHHEFWSNEHRRSDALGFIAWGPLAMAAVCELPLEPSSDYLPRELIELAAAGARSSRVVYEAPRCAARTVAEARVRAGLTTGHGADSPALSEEPAVGEGAAGQLTLRVSGAVEFRFSFDLASSDRESFGAGPSQLLDAGEWVHLAEEAERAALLHAAGSPAWRRERERARAFAEQALACVGDEDEMFRDRMSSPLGRKLCDERPKTFNRAGLLAIVQRFREI